MNQTIEPRFPLFKLFLPTIHSCTKPQKLSNRRIHKMASTNTIAKPQGGAKPVNRLNDLSAKEWIPETVSVWVQRGLGQGHAHAQIERQHPAPFSFQDVARLVRFFSKAGETVLDPFVGVGSTLKAAAVEGRRGIGIELNTKYAKLARLRLKTELNGQDGICDDQTVIRGD